MVRNRFFCLAVAVATVTMLVPAAPAPAQTVPAEASPADRCAAATAILGQLPAAPPSSAPTPAAPASVTTPTYADVVLPGRGIETSAGTISGDTRFGVTFIGEMAGDLPGVLVSSANYTPPSPGPNITNNIVGGEWALCGPWGTVFGSFTGGTVQWNADETLADVVADMGVLGGSVNGIPVTAGTGTFGGVLDHRPLAQGLPPTISGTLQLQTSAAPTPSGSLPSTGGPALVLPVTALLLLLLLLGLGLAGLGILRRFS